MSEVAGEIVSLTLFTLGFLATGWVSIALFEWLLPRDEA